MALKEQSTINQKTFDIKSSQADPSTGWHPGCVIDLELPSIVCAPFIFLSSGILLLFLRCLFLSIPGVAHPQP